MIIFENLTKSYGRAKAVDDLGFEVGGREAVALWGPNGAGKTTVIKCLLGLLRYDGEIEVDGVDARANGRSVRRRLGYVPQELAFYDDMGTLESALFYARLKSVSSDRAEEVLGQVGLHEHAHKPVGALSGGMKQRLALGLALLADPPILVLDEPTSNLDSEARDHLLDLLLQVKADGRTVLFTSHRLEEVESLADWVLVMEDGRESLRCPAQELPTRLGLRSRVKLRLPASAIESAIAVLAADGLSAQPNGSGVLVEVPAGEKARPINVLSRADIVVHDFEVE